MSHISKQDLKEATAMGFHMGMGCMLLIVLGAVIFFNFGSIWRWAVMSAAPDTINCMINQATFGSDAIEDGDYIYLTECE